VSSTDWPSLIVLAKAPVPGRAKTRLSPPCSHEQAATIAAAALADTLEVVVALAGVAARPILVLDGEPGPWLPFGIPVVPQRGCGLDERLAAAFEDVGGPALLIGMDTPQVSTRLLAACLTRLAVPEVSAVLGPAVDGGFWAVGLKVPDAAAFLGVPMSTEYTGMAQRARLGGLGLTVASLPVLGDVDVWEDAISVPVARESRFAAAVARVRLEIALDSRSEDRRR
jgi:glycosyltransferase A (GT-A) superfamily protein (DUF2064 family)